MKDKSEDQKDPAQEAADLKTATQAEKKAAAKPSYPFSVAPGRAITTKAGIIGEGDEVTAKDLTGGGETLKVLVEKGIVIEKK